MQARLKRLSGELETECRQSQVHGNVGITATDYAMRGWQGQRQEDVSLTAKSCDLQDVGQDLGTIHDVCKVCKHPASVLVHNQQQSTNIHVNKHALCSTKVLIYSNHQRRTSVVERSN